MPERLSELRDILASVVHSAIDGFWIVDSTGRFVEVNEAYCQLVGYARDELLGMSIADVEAEESAAETARHIERVHRTGRDRFRSRHRRKDGTIIDVEVSTNRVPREGGLFVVFVRDITQLVAEERMLKTSQEHLQQEVSERAAEAALLWRAVEQLPVSVVVTDAAGGIQFVNPAFTEITGYTLAEVRGSTPRVLKSGVQGPEFYEKLWGTIATGRDWRGEVVNLRKDGSRYVQELTIAPVRDAAGRIASFVGIGHDVTDRKALESQLRQSQKLEVVGQLTGGIAHDFNNILTVIISYGEFIAHVAPAGSELRSDADELLGAARRGATMVRRLLQYSRRDLLTVKPVHLSDAVRDVAALLKPLVRETIVIEVGDATDGADVVLADPTSVEQILMNVCMNARDAMPSGGTLRIQCEPAWLDEGYLATHPWVVPGAYICVSVSDTGVGMDHHTLEHVFEPFFTTKPPGKGTGLGLAMVYGLTKQHNGMVHLYSEPGQGTTVRLYFPCPHGESVEADAAAPAAVVVVEPAGKGTILVVEDDDGIRRATKRALEGHGYSVLTAEDGEEALDLHKANADAIALVITDLVMPKLGGRQLAEALRQNGRSPRILFTSGYSPESIRDQAALAHGSAFLRKPWVLADLLAKVRELAG